MQDKQFSESSYCLQCAYMQEWLKIQLSALAKVIPMPLFNVHKYSDVIRKSFATVAIEFGLTRENFPMHTSFLTDDHFAMKIKDGYYPFGLCVNKEIIGFASLTDLGNCIFEMNNLAVLPEWRHYGFGRQLLSFCKSKALELGGAKITIGIIDENTKLKDWYIANGFAFTKAIKYNWQPFTAGYMEWEAPRK